MQLCVRYHRYKSTIHESGLRGDRVLSQCHVGSQVDNCTSCCLWASDFLLEHKQLCCALFFRGRFMWLTQSWMTSATVSGPARIAIDGSHVNKVQPFGHPVDSNSTIDNETLAQSYKQYSLEMYFKSQWTLTTDYRNNFQIVYNIYMAYGTPRLYTSFTKSYLVICVLI